SKLEDASLLAGGPLAEFDTYTIVARTDLVGITAFRLELLPHHSLPAQGPGRCPGNGNPVLTEVQALAAPRQDAANPVRVFLQNPTADYRRGGWAGNMAIDGNPATGWAIAPLVGKPHWAVFETRDPVGVPGGTVLTFILEQKYPKAPLGRFRLAATTAPRPV